MDEQRMTGGLNKLGSFVVASILTHILYYTYGIPLSQNAQELAIKLHGKLYHHSW